MKNIAEKGYFLGCGNMGEKRRNANQQKDEDRKE